MDSLTQIVLGAAVGEAVLGKKIGNRAMLWGAIGGTIPDLDIIANFFVDDLQALIIHRGFSHSLLFGVLMPLLLAWLVKRLYDSQWYKAQWYKYFVGFASLMTLSVFAFGINFIATQINQGQQSISGLVISIMLFLLLAFMLYKRYISKEQHIEDVSYNEWYLLFFGAIITHPLLDCFTSYGTLLFYPFSNYRVAFSSISVADPVFYTIPFALCLFLASRVHRTKKLRRTFNYTGIIISSAYLLFTVFNKMHVNKVFESSLTEEGYNYTRYTSSPTILNNFLWHCIAQDGNTYYQGRYSIFDKEKKIVHWNKIEQGKEYVDRMRGSFELETLSWFSDGYFNIIENKHGQLQYNDLRYGFFVEKPTSSDDYIFNFILEESDDGFIVHENRDRSIEDKGMFIEYFARMFGKIEE